MCPQGHGKDYCNGECAWCEAAGTCLPELKAKACNLASAGIKKEARKPIKTVQGSSLHLEPRRRAQLSEAANIQDAALTLSVVLACGFEHDYFIRTAESIFYETPAEILKEIVVVDDASEPPLKLLWSEEEATKFGVKYVRLDSPQGLIGAKQAGALTATGDIIVFFDCHVKVHVSRFDYALAAILDIILNSYASLGS